MGAVAHAALCQAMHHDSLEIRQRADRLLQAGGVLPPALAVVADRWIDTFMACKPEDRESSLAALERLGPMALARLVQRLSPPEPNLEVAVRPYPKWCHVEEQRPYLVVDFEVCGEQPLLLPQNDAGHGWCCFLHSLLPPRTAVVRAPAARFFRVCPGDARSPWVRSLVLRPQERTTLSYVGAATDQWGLCEVVQAVAVQQRWQYGGITWTVGLQPTHSLPPAEILQRRVRAFIHVLPHWQQGTAVTGVSLELYPERSTLQVGDALAFKLRLRNGGSQPVLIENDWLRYTWIALAGDERDQLLFTRASLLAGCETACVRRQPWLLLPGDQQEHHLVLTPPVVGTYQLAAGYENLEPEPGLLEGHIVAQGEPITVQPR
jgi:hypothetical protein